MKLLLDANISWRLADRLRPFFGHCYHADNIGLTVPAKDVEIWIYAENNDCIIVTNDDDFLNLANTKGFPPKLVLLRTGNQSSTYIAELLVRHLNDINDLSASAEYGILEIY